MLELDQLASPAAVVRRKHGERGHRQEALWLPLVLAVLMGVLVRGIHIFGADFPLNDGGMFYAMTEDLREAGYRLPTTTSYNSAAIPFAYPPLAFYAAALVRDITGLSLIEVFRILPFIVSSLTIVAFLFFARSLGLGGPVLLAAVIAFGLTPRSFLWLLMGGGLTRSFGFLFAILSLHQVYRLYRERRLWFAVPAGIFAALTVLSHIQTAAFVVFSTVLFFVFLGRHRAGLLGSIVMALVAIAVSGPWLLTILSRHGAEPFLAASATGGSIFTDADARRGLLGTLVRLGVGSWSGASTAEPLFPLIGTLALLGALVSLVSGLWLVPLWWLAILVLDTRAGLTYASIPVSILAGIGVTKVILPAIRWSAEGFRGALTGHNGDAPSGIQMAGFGPVPRSAIVVLTFFVVYATGSALFKDPGLSSDIRFLVSLSPEERQAMQWVSRGTPENARFLVVPDSEWDGWWADKNSEWFPVLARRTSAGTVQGTEWLPQQTFKQMADASKELRQCGHSISICLDQWANATGRDFTHVFIPQPNLTGRKAYLLCCQLLVRSLNEDPRYQLIYSGPGAMVFAKRESPT